jgi:UDP-2,3-diacylglucosamine pyrophosphatase LpxH
MNKKCSIMSDLHLEFDDLTLEGGDALVLAGDCFLACVLDESKTDVESRRIRQRMIRFAQNELKKYEKVFYVAGNHDFYGSSLESTPKQLRDFFAAYAPNTVLLDRATEIYEGIAFIGATLWATYGYKTDSEYEITKSMMDFTRIRTMSKHEDGSALADIALLYGGRTIVAADIMREHKKAVAYIKKTLQFTREQGLPSIILTHHAPSYLSKSKRFKYIDSNLDDAYYSNLHQIIENNPQIAIWVHGHTHDSCNYGINTTRIISNQRGYADYESCASSFNQNAEDFDLEEIRDRFRNLDHGQAGSARPEGDDPCEQELFAGIKPAATCGGV